MTDLLPIIEAKGQPNLLPTIAVARVQALPEWVDLLDRRDKLLAQAQRVPDASELAKLDKGIERATDLAKLVSRLNKAADTMRKNLVGPYDKTVKAVNKVFKETFTALLEQAERNLKRLIADTHAIKEREAQEAARKAAEEAERQALELAAKAQEIAGEAAADAILEAGAKTAEAEIKAAKTGPVRGEGGSASVRKVWKWRVTDLSQVPREFLTVDKVLVDKAVGEGVRDIPGLEIFQESQVALR